MTTMRRFVAHLALCAMMVAAASGALQAASLESVFSRSDETAAATVDHGPWSALLARYRTPGPDGIARFAYADVTGEDRAALDAYIAGLAAIEVTALARAAQLAYWINLYNALTIRVVLDNYPVASIRDISSGFFSSGPWGADLVTVEGHDLSLDDIEHEVLRPLWRDARIHYAVNCASMSCPDLAAVAFTAQNAQALLEQGAHDYINHSRGVRVEDGRIIASSLYDWYAGDFGSALNLMAHLRRYAEPDLATRLAGHTHVNAYAYDWALNEK